MPQPLAGPRRLLLAAAVVTVLSSSCASEADLEAQFTRGIKAARASEWKPAIDDLEAYTAQACRAAAHPAAHCREAYVALARGYEQRGEPARAWITFDAGLALPPHKHDQAVQEDRERAERELQDRQQQAHDHGPALVRYRDEVTDEYTPRSVTVSIDFSPVFTNDKHAAELRSPDYTRVWAGSIVAGPHVLLVEADHGCKPGEARCAPSHVRQAWSFDTRAHTPITLEVRAFAETRSGDAMARPALDFKTR